MTYAQDLTRLHRERKARLWPVSKPTMAPHLARIGTLKSEIKTLRERLEGLTKDLEAARALLIGEGTLRGLREQICKAHSITIEDIVGDRRKEAFVLARKHFAWAARANGASCTRIAYYLGGRHHTTILYYLGCAKSNDAEPVVG